MEKLKCIKHKLVDAVYNELSKDIHCINTEELGEAVDMIKDISKALYYCSVVEEMEESKETMNYFFPVRELSPHKFYYTEPWEKGHMMMEDYLKDKEKHTDEKMAMEDLEKYLDQVTKEVTRMAEHANAEEKTLMHQKVSHLVTKLA